MSLTPEQIDEIGHALRGTGDSIETVLERMEIEVNDVDEVESAIADIAERCQSCDWWYEPCMLVSTEDDDAEPGICDDCRE